MTIEVALALLAASAPITAGIIVWRPGKKENNGKYVMVREYDSFRVDLGDRLNRIEGGIGDLCNYVKSRLP